MFCPFTRDTCQSEECRMFLRDDEACAVTYIAKSLKSVNEALLKIGHDMSGILSELKFKGP
jgi:hypothetical protein